MRRIAYYGSLVVIFLIPWEEAFTIGSFGTITRIVGVFSMIFWLGSILISGKFRRPNWFYILAFLFILWNIISLVWTVDIDQSMQQVITYIQLGLLAYLLWDLYTTASALRAAMQIYILGSYVTIISTVINYIQGQQIYIYSGGRYAGAGLNAVDLALTLSLGLPIAWYLALINDSQTKNRFLTLVNYIFIPSALFAIVLSGSRTALFTTIPAIIYILSTIQRFRPFSRLVIFFILIGSLIILQQFIPQSVIERFATTATSIITGDLGGRVSLWQASGSIFLESPLIGIGSGALSSPIELSTVAHNTYLSILTELGLVGFLFYLGTLVSILLMIIVQTKPQGQLWFAVFMVWIIGVLSLTWEYRKVTWIMFSMIAISADIYRQQYRKVETVKSQGKLPLQPLLQRGIRVNNVFTKRDFPHR